MFLATVFITLITLLNIIVYYLRKHHEEGYDERSHSSSSSSSDQLCRRFSLAEIKSATHSFDEALVVGKGGFGKVYRGTINNPERTVAIKRLDLGSKQGATEFWTEIEMLSKFRHSHLVSLLGYCNDYQEMIIVYEYMSAGSLRDHLHKIGGSLCKPFVLSWLQRLNICIGAARGLDYLHTGTSTQQRVIHRDVKSSNILLDENWAAKISDFGLSKVGPANQDCTHVSTHIKGTFGYMDPEYYLTRRVTRKSDVYALGVVLLEVLCGRPALDSKLNVEQHSLAIWAKNCIKEGKLDQMIDPSLTGQILPPCLKEFSQVANQCLHNQSKKRPTMDEVVVRLEFALSLQERIEFSVLEEQINVGVYDKQENMDSSTEQEEQSDGYTRSGGARRARKSTFIRKVLSLFSMKTPVPSIEVDEASWAFPDGLESFQFDFGTITTATENFADANKVGQGGFGSIYKGTLQNGQEIAVKMLDYREEYIEQVFKNEAMSLEKVRHKNLVRLLGFCVKGREKLLIYEFVQNGSLDHFLFDADPYLDWDHRYKIIRGVARGILYLHEEAPFQIIHRNIKPSNILLDAEFNPKISGFALANLQKQHGSECVSDLIMGSYGYLEPEYMFSRRFSVKTDVYSFGILLLEVIRGQKMFHIVSDGTLDNGSSEAWRKWREGRPLSFADSTLRADPYDEGDVVRCIQIGLLCIQSVDNRPTMGTVVLMLSTLAPNLPQPSEPPFSIPDSARDTSIGSGEDSITD